MGRMGNILYEMLPNCALSHFLLLLFEEKIVKIYEPSIDVLV